MYRIESAPATPIPADRRTVRLDIVSCCATMNNMDTMADSANALLIEAITTADEVALTSALAAGANAHITDSTVLCNVAYYGHAKIVRILRRQGKNDRPCNGDHGSLVVTMIQQAAGNRSCAHHRAAPIDSTGLYDG